VSNVKALLAIAWPCVSVDDLDVYSALFDSDLDAVAKRLGETAEGLAEDSGREGP
jgi:hypothetical protein